MMSDELHFNSSNLNLLSRPIVFPATSVVAGTTTFFPWRTDSSLLLMAAKRQRLVRRPSYVSGLLAPI